MRRVFVLLVVLAAAAAGQSPLAVQYRYLYTFGSRLGIHPPKLLNGRTATLALGQGEHPYGLAYPAGVTTDNRNRVWITDSGTSSIHVFDVATGAYREIRRADNVPFQQPSGIATDRAGRVYVADSGVGNVFVFGENGDYDRPLIPLHAERLLEAPTAIAMSDDGATIFVADPPKNAVVALNREGEAVGMIHLPPEMRGASGLAVVNNQIYVLGEMQHRVEVFSPAGLLREEKRWDDIRTPMAFTFDTANKRFLVANPKLMVVEAVSEEGQGLAAFGRLGDGVDQMKHVDALHVDAQGRIFVVDSHEGKVLVFAGNAPPDAKGE